ncbi:TetR/AcrR family transcriptional regulator [Poseidonibacter lekithochrous]|uniref:TetR/AcrR family transcriptional regulator n=1 Tax=Poseidonibacter TaxID=2321187 RepID=UPI001C08B760|nr:MULTISPECIES: TetR/AcrR family transcriptional regulator [Poseidonibacter]MBU3015398.1 TetR/AcrR family transcriptional regulator [Poseidonibacter lekithochrous]MDO6828697.1 TetR/AcrR family transcriptional regulator [Poseidonibacter sp. 1_MG-2023]
MPKIVDKEQKRKDIALACSDLIHDLGIKKITVAQVAKTAGIGKGTVYGYFENKEDIIFEIINIHIEKYHNNFLKSIKDLKSTREKVFHFFNFVIDNSEENLKHFNGYKEYLSIVLSDNDEKMIDFNDTCNVFFHNQLKKVIQEGIDEGDLMPKSIDFCESLIVFEKGLVLKKMTEVDFNPEEICLNFINNLFDLIEIKKGKKNV